MMPQISQHVEEQSTRLRGVYTDMQNRFLKNGLKLEEISEVRTGFRGTDACVTSSPGKTLIAPREYSEDYPGGPFPVNAVRLLVLPLDGSHKLSSAGTIPPLSCSSGALYRPHVRHRIMRYIHEALMPQCCRDSVWAWWRSPPAQRKKHQRKHLVIEML